MQNYGPQTVFADKLHQDKYRAPGETFREAATRIASCLSDGDAHFKQLREILLDMRFLPGGRIQAAIGSTKITTPYNCYVSGTIEDSFIDGSGSIMRRAQEAAQTMRLGGGIGYDFSTLRPRGELIRKLQSQSSGPVSFMDIFDAVCRATCSSGHRRGAQMGVLRVDHPDIEEFVFAKQNANRLTGFNISVAITDEFMNCVAKDLEFPLRWGGRVYRTIRAADLWNTIMRSNYDWAEPGVLFIDTINERNNLHYCETIAATNPCGEQPLPPFGACLLGSFNLVKYLKRESPTSRWSFDWKTFHMDIPVVVAAMDNVVDRARYPLHEQEQEARSKRRMGLGVTGLANCLEAQGAVYGSQQFCWYMSNILTALKNQAYQASALRAKELGAFPLYDESKYLEGEFIKELEPETQDLIEAHGIRNSHLLSIAPTGTISLAADNVSSGIEPVYDYVLDRTVIEFDGPRVYTLEDYGYHNFGVRGKRAAECSADDHLNVLIAAAPHIDSAISKTCNIAKDYPFTEFKDLYMKAWYANCKGCTTYRTGGKREAILVSKDSEESGLPPVPELTCEIDLATGRRSCE